MSTINGSQVKILEALASGRKMSRKDIAEKTGIQKGFSKLLGAQESPADTALEPMGLVKTEEPAEGERGLQYTITAAGKKALEKALKEAKEEKPAKKEKKAAAPKVEEKADAKPAKKAPAKKKKAAAAAE